MDKHGRSGLSGLSTSSTESTTVRNDALQALMALGYQRAAAEKAIRNVVRDQPEEAKTVDKLIRAALKEATSA